MKRAIDRQEFIEAMATEIKDQLDNGAYTIVRNSFSRESYLAAAELVVARIESRLTASWDVLMAHYCPEPRERQPLWTEKEGIKCRQNQPEKG